MSAAGIIAHCLAASGPPASGFWLLGGMYQTLALSGPTTYYRRSATLTGLGAAPALNKTGPIAFDLTQDGRLWFSGGGFVCYSTDLGSTFSSNVSFAGNGILGWDGTYYFGGPDFRSTTGATWTTVPACGFEQVMYAKSPDTVVITGVSVSLDSGDTASPAAVSTSAPRAVEDGTEIWFTNSASGNPAYTSDLFATSTDLSLPTDHNVPFGGIINSDGSGTVVYPGFDYMLGTASGLIVADSGGTTLALAGQNVASNAYYGDGQWAVIIYDGADFWIYTSANAISWSNTGVKVAGGSSLIWVS
jgi:hypothetical protein